MSHPKFTTLYLGYSSNLSPTTMKQRCPDSLFVGLALLKDYKWIINTTSYANIIPNPGTLVYGSLYFLSSRDEKALDISEGVPWLYTKQYLNVQRIIDGKVEEKMTEVLVYVDGERLEEGEIEVDYKVWVRKAMDEAVRLGVPDEWVKRYLGKWIGEEEGRGEICMVRTLPAERWRGGVGGNMGGMGVRGRVMGGLDRG